MISTVSFRNANIHFRPLETGQRSYMPQSSSEGRSQRELLSDIWKFRSDLKQMKSAMQKEVQLSLSGGAKIAQVVSSSLLSLTSSSTSASRTSSEEINTEATYVTSISDTTPDFEGNSNSQATFSGEYDGSLGNDTLTFTVIDGGNVGGPYTEVLGILPADLTLEARNKDGTLIDTIAFSEDTAVGTEFELSNGLSVSFSGGSLEEGDSFDLSLSHSKPGSAVRNKAFDATGGNDANLDIGYSITNGSFDLNGTTINVNASDTIDDVLERITNSAANVNASFNQSTDSIMLKNKTEGSSGAVSLANDTSGFLAATKLDNSTFTAGTDNGYIQTINTHAELSSILSGDFFVNGNAINIDTSADSLSDVITAINDTESGVTAKYSGGRIIITADDGRTDISLANGTSNFFAALGIETGIFKPGESSGPNAQGVRAGSNYKGVSNATESISKHFEIFERRLRDFFAAEYDSGSNYAAKLAKDGVRSAIQDTFHKALGLSYSESRERKIDTGFGLSFTLSSEGNDLIDFNKAKIRSGLRKDPRSAHEFFFAENAKNKKSGFFEALDDALEKSQNILVSQLGSSAGGLLYAYA